MDDCVLIIDEKKGRRTAMELGIEITGTFGVLKKGLEDRLIVEPETTFNASKMPGFIFPMP